MKVVVILDVKKLDKSNDVKDVHPLNIPPISVISDVSNWDKFKDIKDVQSLNILPASKILIFPELQKLTLPHLL